MERTDLNNSNAIIEQISKLLAKLQKNSSGEHLGDKNQRVQGKFYSPDSKLINNCTDERLSWKYSNTNIENNQNSCAKSEPSQTYSPEPELTQYISAQPEPRNFCNLDPQNVQNCLSQPDLSNSCTYLAINKNK